MLLISAHTSNARTLAARYSLAETWSRRRWKRLLIWSWAERNRCACRADLKRFICRSRRRVGWCEFSARLLSPLCRACSTPGISSFFAAGWPARRSGPQPPGGRPLLGGGIARQLVRDQHARRPSLPLEQLAQQTLGGLLVAPALHQHLEHEAGLVDRPP